MTLRNEQIFKLGSLLSQRGLIMNSKGCYTNLRISKSISLIDLLNFYKNKKNRVIIKNSIKEKKEIKIDHDTTIPFSTSLEQEFSSFMEYYLSHLLMREFGMFASGFDVKIEGIADNQKLDVVGISTNGLIHIECKSGSPKNIKGVNIDLFIRRCRDLSAYIGIMYIDSEGLDNEGQKFNINHLINNPVLLEVSNAAPILKITNDDNTFCIYRSVIEPIYIIDCTKGSGTPIGNLRKTLTIHHRLERERAQYDEISKNTEFKISVIDNKN